MSEINFLDDVSSLSEAVMLSLGAASMCWDQTPSGVFDSEMATQIGERLISWIEQYEAV